MNKNCHESGDRNCYQFLFNKLLAKHFPEQVWTSTYDQIKKEAQKLGKPTNIHWKSILNSIATKGLTLGVDSNEWQTLLKLLEIVRSVGDFLQLNGKVLIRFDRKHEGRETANREVFIEKCRNTIKPNIESLIRDAINHQLMFQEAKNIFLRTVDPGVFHIELDRFQDDKPSHNYDYAHQEENFVGTPSKKIKTGNFTNDCTYTPGSKEDEKEEIFEYDGEMQNVDVEEQNKSLLPNVSHSEQTYPKNDFIAMGTALQQFQISDKEKIENLEKALKEKNRTIEELNQIITNLSERLKIYESLEEEKEVYFNDNFNQNNEDDPENGFNSSLFFK